MTAKKTNPKEKIAKHLTAMKELPSYLGSKKKLVKPKIITKSVKKEKVQEKKGKTKIPEKVIERGPQKEEGLFTAKDIILGVINIITVGFLIFLLSKLPQVALEHKELRNEGLAAESGVSFEFGDVENAKEKSDKIQRLFADDKGVVEFIRSVEKIKDTPDSVITKVSFASQDPVKDKAGADGIPMVIEMRGSWSGIGADLEKIEELPFFFRTAKIETEFDEDGLVKFKYGGLLYVKD
jgi:hypothetical protein